MESLPTELILEIPHHLPDDLADLAALTRTSRHFYRILNPVLYKRDVQSGAPRAPFWAAETGSVGTLRHARAAGADLDETRLFSKPRGHMSDPYGIDGLTLASRGAGAGAARQTARKRRNSAGAVGAVGVGAAVAFLDWAGDVRTVAAAAPRFWWHPVDLAAYFGHGGVVEYLASEVGVSMSLSRSRGLCEFNCRPGLSEAFGSEGLLGMEGVSQVVRGVAEVPVRPQLNWAIHSPAQLARCAGHRELAVLIQRLGQVEVRREGAGKKKEGGNGEGDGPGELLERVVVEPFSYRDFVLERF
ncbi:hypothetical protein QBC47DRAFT_427216 [Echria macrotheca]|uniref:F-box domain-containing protein n=1 Tax=Echria macrotheca TaxID=438768 RepID=A0AAJ0BKZ5_9PEZI|nr:hypothetical protein QBC47DRAFT_427216 [Echria macrotheca]